MKTPGDGWVSTTSSMITPDPTGTCVVLAMTFGAAGAAGVVAAGVVASVAELAAGWLLVDEHAATTKPTRPTPVPMNTVRRPSRRYSGRIDDSFCGSWAGRGQRLTVPGVVAHVCRSVLCELSTCGT